MNYKLLILTSDKSLTKWKTLPSKLADIKNTLNKTKNATWEVDVRYQDLKPLVNSKGRIDHTWYNTISYPLFREGYQEIYMHFSLYQRNQLGLDGSIGGATQNDTDFVGESYGWADENTKRGRSRLNQFVQNVLHELRHSLNKAVGRKDDTHDVHKTGVDITRVDWSVIDMNNWQPKYQEGMKKVSLLERILELTKTLIGLKKKSTRPTKLTPLVARKAEAIITAMAQIGHPVRLVEGYRSFERQTELYNQGRTTKGNIVTNAKAGESLHNYGVAVDFVFRKEGYDASNELWKLLGDVGKSQGFEWGGDWKGFVDKPHFQLTLGYSLKDFQSGKVDYSKFN